MTLKTVYKHIDFVPLSQTYGSTSHIADMPVTPTTNKDTWVCRNLKSKDVLGFVSYHANWRQYCFFPVGGNAFYVVLSVNCMLDVIDFIQQLGKL